MSQTIKINVNESYEKIKIIALTGKYGSGIYDAQTNLINHCKNFKLLPMIKAGENLSTDTFLKKLVNGDIIEAHCSENGAIWGLDISQLLTCYVYVGVFTPDQIEILTNCDEIELLSVYVDLPMHARVRYMIMPDSSDESVRMICENFIKERYREDILEDINNCLHIKYGQFEDFQLALKNERFLQEIRTWNWTEELITNLDNFI